LPEKLNGFELEVVEAGFIAFFNLSISPEKIMFLGVKPGKKKFKPAGLFFINLYAGAINQFEGNRKLVDHNLKIGKFTFLPNAFPQVKRKRLSKGKRLGNRLDHPARKEKRKNFI
jgi:hypothetical protein